MQVACDILPACRKKGVAIMDDDDDVNVHCFLKLTKNHENMTKLF